MRTRLVSLLTGVGFVACSSNPGPPDAPVNCEADSRDEVVSAGLAKTAGDLKFTLTALTPEPPARFENDWTISITEAGSPVAGAAVVVTPFMPDHQHGPGVDPVVSETAPGVYAATPIRLWMPGYWEVTVAATATAGGATEQVVFRPCIRP